MPLHHGSWAHQDQGLPPSLPELSQSDPEKFLSRRQATARSLCVQRKELLAQVYQCGAWKCCDKVEGDGKVTRLYSYQNEPESIYPLKVTMYSLGRAYTVKVDSAKEIFHA